MTMSSPWLSNREEFNHSQSSRSNSNSSMASGELLGERQPLLGPGSPGTRTAAALSPSTGHSSDILRRSVTRANITVANAPTSSSWAACHLLDRDVALAITAFSHESSVSFAQEIKSGVDFQGQPCGQQQFVYFPDFKTNPDFGFCVKECPRRDGEIMTVIYLWRREKVSMDRAKCTKYSSRHPASYANDPVMLSSLQISAVVMCCAAILFLLFAVVNMSRLLLAGAFISHAARALSQLKRLLVLPFISYVLLLLLFGWGILVTVCIFGAGETSSRIATISATSPSSIRVVTESFQVSTKLRWLFIYHLWGMYWSVNFLLSIGEMITATAMSLWYFSPENRITGLKEFEEADPVSYSAQTTIKYHLGTLALSSGSVAPVEHIRSFFLYLENKNEFDANALTEFAAKCCCVSFWIYETSINMLLMCFTLDENLHGGRGNSAHASAPLIRSVNDHLRPKWQTALILPLSVVVHVISRSADRNGDCGSVTKAFAVRAASRRHRDGNQLNALQVRVGTTVDTAIPRAQRRRRGAGRTDTSRDEEVAEAEAEHPDESVASHLQQQEQTHDHLEETSRTAVCACTVNNPLRGDTNLKIFLPSDSLALKAILSPKNSSVGAKENEMMDSGSSSNLIDKLLFRNVPAPLTPKRSVGSVVEEDLGATNVVVMNSNLPPPPFANMYACESCREDIGSLLSKGRHHCRNCGGSFCANCTTKTIVVPYQAYLTRGELRVCDGCFHRIQNFQKQVKSTSVTWSGLQPPSNEVIVRDFELSEDEVPVSIFNCALFLETTPFYGHLVLTRKRLCFQSYVDAKKRKVAYAQIVSLLKPQFYYINGLQVKTKRKETFFLAEFNGLRDTCFLRLDQLIRAYQEASKLIDSGPGKSPSSKELRKQALDRRRSYKLISEHIVSSGTSANPPLSSSSAISTVGFIDEDEDNADVPLSDIVEEGGHTDDGRSTASDEEPFEPLPPDPLLEKMTVLLDCDMRADVKRVFDLLWNDGPGQEFSYANMEKARDIDIDIESWKAIDKNDTVKAAEIRKGFEISKEDDYTLYRMVRSQHPPKTSFPGLPPYAGCTRTQRFRLDKSSNGGDKWDRFVITELNRMSKIPFSDYFEVEMRYVFSRDGNNYCHVQVGLVVNFLKATWFKSQINSSTRSESKEALESWAKQAIEFLESQRNRVVPLSPTLRSLSTGSFNELESEPGSAIHPVLKRAASGTRPTLKRLKSAGDPAPSKAEPAGLSVVDLAQSPRSLTLKIQQSCEGPSVEAAMEILQRFVDASTN
ncbi:protein of unknown function DUF4782 [Phytophthora cactorum]|nr:protein of unknown function DUF4782 [Phytophthora cactorum]